MPKIISQPENLFIIQQITPIKSVEKKEKEIHESWLKKSFKDFCNSSSLHGFNYIYLETIPKWERIIWTIFLLAALIMALTLILLSWTSNTANVITTVIENTHYATWNIAFPAVTICNLNKISRVAALQMATNMKRPDGMSPEELSQMFRLVLHFDGAGQAKRVEYDELHWIMQDNNLTIRQLMRRIAPRCTDMLIRCLWKGTQTRCDNLFQPVNTSEGVCCSFNNHAFSQTNFALKMIHTIQKRPRKVTACGFLTGLSVLVKPHFNDYHSTYLNSRGFRVFIHNSYNYAGDNSETKYVISHSEAFLTISPENTYSTNGFRELSLKDRGCYYYNDRQLTTMQNYTYLNCMAECRSEFFWKMCQCVPINFPNNGSFPVCEMNRMVCVRHFSRNANSALPGLNYSAINVADTECNCLPDCTLLQYTSELTSGGLNRKYSLNMNSFFTNINLTDESFIHVYFNDLVTTLYRRDIITNWMASLGAFGGLLGLLLGFSFVSAFELIYFFAVKPFHYHLTSTIMTKQ